LPRARTSNGKGIAEERDSQEISAFNRPLGVDTACFEGLLTMATIHKSFEIQPVLGAAVPAVASFIHRWHADREGSLSLQRIERRLQWLLIENPLTTDVSHHGFCIRDDSGVIRGLDLSFPGAFLAGDQRLLGLCSGSYFVEPQAQGMGFFLFKKYLNSSGYSFFFATTCSAASSPIWQKSGASAVPDSEMEYILPLKLDVMIPAFLSTRTSSRLAAGIARTFGRCANLILHLLAQGSGKLTVERCQDWEKLSELFRRHRSKNLITTERSAQFLQWRYGPGSPNHPPDIYVFRDQLGNEGWFSLGKMIRRRHQVLVRGCVLLDAIWPREKMSFRDILPAILQHIPSKADAIFFRSRPGLDYSKCNRLIIPRRLDTRHWVMTRKGGARLQVAALDLVIADGDSAWTNSILGELDHFWPGDGES
jgi:hypothetical protein